MLTPEGARVQPDWLYAFLRGPITIRPWLNVRMPTFGLDDRNLNGVIRYFGAVSNNMGRSRRTRSCARSASERRLGKAAVRAAEVPAVPRARRIPKDQPTVEPRTRPSDGARAAAAGLDSRLAEEPGGDSAGHAHAGVLARLPEVVLSAVGRRTRTRRSARFATTCSRSAAVRARWSVTRVGELERHQARGHGQSTKAVGFLVPFVLFVVWLFRPAIIQSQPCPPPPSHPGGTRDFLPDDVRRREYVIRIVRDVYERYGFEPLETPAFENIETLLGKYGEEGNKLIFKILRRGEHAGSGEADLALRYDLTVPLARVVAQYQNELPKFFKRYQIQPVWRADRPARGRFREFYQCDIDAIGSTSPIVEAEQLRRCQRGA